MPALVRYTGRTVRRYAPYAKIHPGFKVAAHLYNNSGRYVRAARVIGGAYRRYRRAKRKRHLGRQHIGESVGTTTAKRREVLNNSSTSLTTRTLYVNQVTLLPKTATNDINSRQRDLINLRGVKICLAVNNTGGNVLYFNYAVIAPKRLSELVGGTTIPSFFRSSSDDARSVNFSSALNAIEFKCLPINVDEYSVLMHRRYTIAPYQDAGGITGPFNTQSKNWMHMMKYQRIGRQMRYNVAQSTPNNNPIYCVFWADQMSTGTGGVAVANAFTVSERLVTYFREPK